MNLIVETDVAVTMRDGTGLATDVYRPDIDTSVPVLLQRTPYGKHLALASPFVEGLRFVREGFALVIQDVRGRFASGGLFTPFQDEPSDGMDTIAWASQQPWSTGRVGMLGTSYVGMTQWLAASGNPAGLACIAPILTATDYRDGWFYRGGAFELGFSLSWALSLALDTAQRRNLADPGLTDRVVEATDRLPGLYRGLTPDEQDVLDDVAPYFAEWRRHPWPDDGWPAVLPIAQPATTTAPALLVGGWYDIFLSGTLRDYERQRAAAPPERRPRLLVGPWSHELYDGRFPGRSCGVRSGSDLGGVVDAQVRWFRRWLKPDARLEDDEEPVRLFVTGVDAWQSFADWPPPSAERRLFLRRSGLDPQPAESDESPDVVHFDPADPVPTAGGASLFVGAALGDRAGPLDQRDVEARPDVVCFDSAELEHDLTVIGWVVADLHVAATTPDIDVAAKLVDVAPDGRAELVTDGILRVSQRRRGRPTPLVPGRVERLEIDLGATAHQFAARHRIRFEIAASNFPRFDLNPDATARGGSVLSVLHDHRHRSLLRLPIVTHVR